MIRADDVVLAVLPLFHVYGLNAVLGGAVRHGATVVLQERFDAQGTLDLVAARGCTMVPLAPAVFRPWLALPELRSKLSTVRLVLSGSAPLPRDLVEEFEERTGIPVHQGYGLTEAAPVVTSTLCSAAHHPGSVGAALRRRRRPARRRARRPGGRRRPGGDRDPRRQPVQRLLARRSRGPRRRGLVGHR